MPDGTMSHTVTPAAEQIWADLMRGNERFRTGAPQSRDLVHDRQAVAQAQHPKTVVLACADSRVAPEIIFDQGLGDLFVVRIAGTVADKQAIGSLEFAAQELRVPLLVVIGHQNCAGVSAACAGGKVGSPNLKAIVAAIRAALPLTLPDGGPLPEAVKANVRYVAGAVLDRSEILHSLVRRGELAVITAYYHMDSGEVERV